ncbi:hypothetical protein [Streptomyces solicathayae]|uniref:Helicase XPB/Ssl2 N-terminal domain-containing protein n=1 Tax=Streptomyces solicathayae TaxID=3081768 RepID=A0ABZ0LP10_9ACTN|nr:hypothetical protein [Streptomyces sp. HUAS YS2]WOX21235.1 hypothetical protein R2D22_07485 [Streptomyces sp. HUAS YS2]
MTGTVLSNIGLDAFLDGTPELRDPSSVRAADAVLGLLALRGADRRSGLPEPTVELVRHVLVEDLPRFVYATPGELALYPAVLVALTQRVREAGRLNGKRQARIVAAVEESAPDFERAMAEPGNLTWQRWYASLLRADGVDADDPEGVRAWLAGRESAVPPDGMHRADLTIRSEFAGTELAALLTSAYVREAGTPPPAGPVLDAHDVSHGVGAVAARLTDRWTAAGLAEALAGPHAHLAPGPDAFPHLGLANMLLDQHLDYYGDSGLPVPPPPFRTPLPPSELEAGADLLAAAVEEMRGETAGLFDGDADHLLYLLYERGCLPESVARRAAEYGTLEVDPGLEDAPVEVPEGTGHAYVLPPVGELSRLIGVRDLTDDDRAELAAAAQAMAESVDRLAGTDMVFRSGDAFGLTPQGIEVVRYLLRAGWVAAPDDDEAAAWDAPTLVAAARNWSTPAAARVLADWLHAHGETTEVWSRLLGALTTVEAGAPGSADTRRLFRALDTSAAPVEALRAATEDPVVGAYASRALAARGEPDADERVPRSARALLILDRLASDRDRKPADLAEAAAAADWPGGAASLTREMAAADPFLAHRILPHLGIEPPPLPGAKRRRRR